MKCSKSIITSLTVCLMFLICSVCSATVYCVKTSGKDSNSGTSWSKAKRTVQAAVKAAHAGDEVWVVKGVYKETIVLKDGVGLYGGFSGSEYERSKRNWKTNVTILDGNEQGSVVKVYSTTCPTHIDGFTIRNGSYSGIYCHTASPYIKNNRIVNNYSWDGGGGISCFGGAPVISRNRIEENTTSGDGGGIKGSWSNPTICENEIIRNDGGGISIYNGSAPIINNRILDNTKSVGYGGGINCSTYASNIMYNVISGNGGSECLGGGIYCAKVPVFIGEGCYIACNLITNNVAKDGGGIYLGEEASIWMYNNTIAYNTASGDGGGIYWIGDLSAAYNCIIAYNSSGVYRQDLTENVVGTHNCISMNTSYDYAPGLVAGTGDINVDPQFADSRCHLKHASPCIDAGDAFVDPSWVDLEGKKRVRGPHVDMGAYEVR